MAVYHRGRLVVDLWGGVRSLNGDPWTRDTLAMCFSTTKGVTAGSARANMAPQQPFFQVGLLGLPAGGHAVVAEPARDQLDERIGMNMVGDLRQYTQFQAAQSLPIAAANEGGVAGAAMLAAGRGHGAIEVAVREDDRGVLAPIRSIGRARRHRVDLAARNRLPFDLGIHADRRVHTHLGRHGGARECIERAQEEGARRVVKLRDGTVLGTPRFFANVRGVMPRCVARRRARFSAK